jgi:hypothetical protein
MDSKDIAYEEWSENFNPEDLDPKAAFMQGVLFGQHLASKECVSICEESTGRFVKQGAYRCYIKIKESMLPC